MNASAQALPPLLQNAGVPFDVLIQALTEQLDKAQASMALKARKQFPDIRLKHSVMAGDSLSDMFFGKRAGMITVLISADATLAKKHPRQIDFLYPDLITLAHSL